MSTESNRLAIVRVGIGTDLHRLAEGGRLILAGILVEQADQVRAAFADLSLLDTLDEEGWRALVLGRSSLAATAPRPAGVR